MTTSPPPPSTKRSPPRVVQLEDGRVLSLFETSDAAVALERLVERDIILLLQLQAFDPESKEWHELMCALIEYGYAVLTGWGVSGLLHQRAATHKGTPGAHRLPATLRLDPAEAMSLAGELLVSALASFHSKVPAAGQCSARGRASRA